MQYCRVCGNPLSHNQDVCLNCGASSRRSDDTGGFGWGLLGFCVPLVGLILYLVWKDEKPITAKAVGQGALISVILNVVVTVLYFILMMALLSV